MRRGINPRSQGGKKVILCTKKETFGGLQWIKQFIRMSVTNRETRATERFTSREKVSAVLRVLQGESVDIVSAELGVPAGRLERWRSDFVAAGSAELSKRKS